MDHIAFFWVGDDTRVPTCLVQSALAVYGNEVQLYQLTDETTPTVSGVQNVYRSALSQDIMVARLQAYAALPDTGAMVFYCDADSLFVKPLHLHALDPTKIHITERDNGSARINPNYPEHYPEFENQSLGEVMPFLFGAMAACNGSAFFHQLLGICQALPARFHRWYGDQVALYAAYRLQPPAFDRLNLNTYLHIERDEVPVARFEELMRQNVKMVTFKGPTSKVHMPHSLHHLQQVLRTAGGR